MILAAFLLILKVFRLFVMFGKVTEPVPPRVNMLFGPPFKPVVPETAPFKVNVFEPIEYIPLTKENVPFTVTVLAEFACFIVSGVLTVRLFRIPFAEGISTSVE